MGMIARGQSSTPLIADALRTMPAVQRALSCLAVAVAALAPASAGRSAPTLAGTITSGSFASAAGRLGYDVYLPPGYADSSLRYPVVYYLHGLPAGSGAFHTFRYVVRAVERDALPVILVAPQAATDSDRDPEYLDSGAGNDWETAIAVQLPGVVDSHYRTIADRTGRALVGVSAGGYGAMLLGLHHLGLYAAIESWSGYFHPTDPTGKKALDLGSTAANRHASAHSFVRSLRRTFARRPTFFAFYVGAQDSRFLAENLQLHRELTAAKVPHVFELYGGGHSQSLWLRHATPWLRLALDHLARAR
jgi:enterochelin esterase-like enzyme